jgi:dihydropteroate synthase
MLSLRDLAALADAHGSDLAASAPPIRIGSQVFDGPVLMGTVNLSRDSTYRESVAVSTESALRKSRVMAAEGATVIDIGAESSTARAARVSAQGQIDALLPVIAPLAADGIIVSTETYEPVVVEAALAAGTKVLNMTGVEHEDAMLDLAAGSGATVVMCFSGGANVREIVDLSLDGDPVPDLLAHFEPRLEKARARGVENVIIDPGMGFFYGNLTDPLTRARHQAKVLLQCFRLRPLGVPICNALPHAFDLFEEHFRTAEGFYAVLAVLGGTSMLRTHEVAQVRAVVRAIETLSV